MRAATCPILLALLAGLAAGCQSIGAEALANGRAAWNEVITRSADEQLLALIVRDRYDESFGLLRVASVTAQVELGTGADVQVGVGPLDHFTDNLVPFAAGVSYSESPTISYVPMSGEALLTRLVAPVSLDHAVVLQRFDREPGQALRLLVRRANGHANSLRPGLPPSPDFLRLTTLLTSLPTGSCDLVAHDGGHALLLRDGPGQRATVRELLELLGLTAFREGTGDLLVPVRTGFGSPSAGDELVLETRSILEVLRCVGAGIALPEEHLAAGIVAPPPVPADEPILRIRASAERPADAAVAVRHRGWWFCVAASDTPGKRAFVQLRALLAMGLDTEGGATHAPLLTLPVRG